MMPATAHAAASQITDLEAQAQAVSQKLVQQQLQIGAYQQQFTVASTRVTDDARAIDQIGQQISQDQQQVVRNTSEVRQLAIRAYMSGGAQMSGSVGLLFGGNTEADQAAHEYAAIAAGNIETAIDQLYAAERTLQATQVTLEQKQIQDQTDQQQRATALAQADNTQHQLASLQSQVTGQLALAVAAQGTAADQSAAAAVTAALRTSVHSTGGDPALNAYLRCVVRAESGGNYGAVSPGGAYMGAFQFSQSTWNMAARAAGRPDLIGVPPNAASKADQDALAVALYSLDGRQPWLGDRC